MTRNQFMIICAFYMIAPSIALENVNVVDAITHNDMDRLIKILESEF